jgi:hypothetical protein
MVFWAKEKKKERKEKKSRKTVTFYGLSGFVWAENARVVVVTAK